MSSPIVTGLLAYGMSGRVFHAPFISTNPNFRLKAVAERHEKKAAQQYPDIVSYNHTDELLQDDEIELVIINTPNHTHYQLTKQALEAGKHVLVEKPAAITVEQVKTLYHLAKTKNLQLMVFQNRRWDSDFLSVKEIIESGRLGNLIEVHFRFDRYRPLIGPKVFKEGPEYTGNGLVYDLGPHLIDQAISLFGKPLSFHKVTARHRDQTQVDDYFNFQLTYPHQLNVFLTSSLLVAEPLPSFVIHGTAGSYIKNRCDVQEAQLDAGVSPTDAQYGLEPEGCEGRLVTMGINNQKFTEAVPSCKGDYSHIFEAVYQSVRHQALFPIGEEHIAWQVELLEA